MGEDHREILTAYRHILCQSPVFAAMVSGNFQEGSTAPIRLPNDGPEEMIRMLEFLYGSAQRAIAFDESGPAKARKLLWLFIAADKYDLPDSSTPS